MDTKQTKFLYNLLSKMTTVFPAFYLFKSGYVISSNNEKPFLAQIDEKYVELFQELFNEFNLVYIKDIKLLKKVLAGPKPKDGPAKWPKLEDQFYLVTSKIETASITNLLGERLDGILHCEKWESFLLSDDPSENDSLLKSLFTNNDYINFLPKGEEEVPILILTKSLIPLVTEKNYTKLYYSSRKVIDGLYQIIFDFQFDLFRLYMYHSYIPIDGQSDKE